MGYKVSKEHKTAISEANKGNKNSLGASHSEDVKSQIKESVVDFYKQENEIVKKIKEQRRKTRIKLNILLKDLKKKPIIQLDLVTNEPIKEWDSASDIGKAFGVSPTSFTRVCKGKSEYAYGFKWSYKNTQI